MPYYPNIPGYAPFFVQTEGDASAVNILTQYGVVVRTHDYPMQRSIKEPYKNDWHDEHGDDEYLGGGLFLEAFTFKAECVMLLDAADSETARETLKNQIRAVQDYLCSGVLKVYDSWTRFGFRNVRVSSFPMPGPEDFSSVRNNARVLFTIEFKVNDPKTEMKMANGKIVEA